MTYEEIVSYVEKKAAKAKVNVEGAVQVDITGEGEGAFYVATKEGQIEVAPYEYFDHDAKIVADGAEFVAYLDGKADESVLTVIGDVEKAALVKGLVSKASKAAAKPAAKKAEKPAEVKAEAAKEEKKAAPAKKAAKKPAAKKEEKPVEVKAEAAKEEKKAAPAKKTAKKSAAKK